MALTLTCPRCSADLSVAEDMAGHYAFCESCKGRVWIERARADDAAMGHPAATDVAARPPAPPAGDPMAPVPAPGGGGTGPPPQPPPAGGSVPAGGAEGPPPVAVAQGKPAVQPANLPGVKGGTPAAPTAQPRSSIDAAPPRTSRRRRVAKVITADVASSRLQIGAEGELPALALAEGSEGQRPKGLKAPTSQWQWTILATVSLGLCVLMLMIEEPGGSRGPGRIEAAARQRIKQMYLGADDQPLKPYQRYLREAQLAHARGDRDTEQRYYRNVLRLLRAEHLDVLYECGPNDPNDEGVTGQRCKSINDDSQPSDQDLERLVLTLLIAK